MELFSLSPPLGTLPPIAQLELWEQWENTPAMQKPTETVQVGFSVIPQMFVTTYKLSDAPESLAFFSQGSFVLWPKHPLNTDNRVPFFSDSVSQTYPMNYSASRSMFLFLENDLYSIKIPTNQPNPKGKLQPTKAQFNGRGKLSLRRSQAIKEVDLALGESETLKVLLDVVAYVEKNTENGFVLRDLRPLQDGNYYLPAFSIAYVGEQIYSRFKDVGTFEEFWGTHYAAAVGRAKAELLFRYGLQMNAPNAQNILVQLDRNFLPTGKIFIRDIVDSRYYETVANALGFDKLTHADNRDGVPLISLLRPETETSFWQMDQGGISPATLKKWADLHDQAFVATVVKTLNLPADNYRTLHDIQNLFATDSGISLLQKYAKRRQE
jgi:hypothetical protein